MSNKPNLIFMRDPEGEMGKITFYWSVVSAHDNSYLGCISWHAPWRRYVFKPQSNSLFDASCLSEVQTHINAAMVARNE